MKYRGALIVLGFVSVLGAIVVWRLQLPWYEKKFEGTPLASIKLNKLASFAVDSDAAKLYLEEAQASSPDLFRDFEAASSEDARLSLAYLLVISRDARLLQYLCEHPDQCEKELVLAASLLSEYERGDDYASSLAEVIGRSGNRFATFLLARHLLSQPDGLVEASKILWSLSEIVDPVGMWATGLSYSMYEKQPPAASKFLTALKHGLESEVPSVRLAAVGAIMDTSIPGDESRKGLETMVLRGETAASKDLIDSLLRDIDSKL